MKKVTRSIVHAVYAAIGIALLALADPAVLSFVQNHLGAAVSIPLLVAVLRAIETSLRGK